MLGSEDMDALCRHRCCSFLKGLPAEKISGGFYRGTELEQETIACKHNYFAMVYVLKGAGHFVDQQNRAYSLKPGALFLRFPGKVFSRYIDKPGEWVEFASAVPRSLYSSLAVAGIVQQDYAFQQLMVSKTIIGRALQFIECLEKMGPHSSFVQPYSLFFNR